MPAPGHGDLQLDMRESDWRTLVGSEVSNPGAFIIPSNDGRFESTDTNIEYTRGGEGVTGFVFMPESGFYLCNGKKVDLRARNCDTCHNVKGSSHRPQKRPTRFPSIRPKGPGPGQVPADKTFTQANMPRVRVFFFTSGDRNTVYQKRTREACDG